MGIDDDDSMGKFEEYLKYYEYIEEGEEEEVLQMISVKHSNPSILLKSLFRIIKNVELDNQLRVEAALLLGEYDDFDEDAIDISIDMINDAELDDRMRLTTAYALYEQSDNNKKLYNAIYRVLRDRSLDAFHKEILEPFLTEELSKNSYLAFDTLVAKIANDTTIGKNFLTLYFDFTNQKNILEDEQMKSFNRDTFQENIYTLIDENKISQVFDRDLEEIILQWNN